MNKQQAELLNGIALAYIGDAIYEVFVREYLLDKGLTKADMLQKNATKFVSAKSQISLHFFEEWRALSGLFLIRT
ncbi:hypothetical protein PS016_23655, partial [Shigella sonnei]|nr:hypothetical protein [Shigella sonnei]